MILKVFTIRDIKAGAYLPPFLVKTTGLAHRSFQDAANNSDHDFNKYPSDYELFELGTFNDEDASFSLSSPKSLGLALDFVLEQA